MMRRPMMMILALAAGMVFNVALERSMAGSALDPANLASPQARAEQASDETPGNPTPTGETAGQAEVVTQVKTADVEVDPQPTPDELQVLTGDNYIDGQASAASAPVPHTVLKPVTPPVSKLAEPIVTEPVIAAAEAAGEPSPASVTPSLPTVDPVPHVVHTNYREALREATESRKLLFIYFHEIRPDAAQRAFEHLTLASREIQEKLRRYVILRLPRNAEIPQNGKMVKLLDHEAFAEMQGRQGVAILDLAHEQAPYYGHVVSTFPFTPGKFYRKEALSIILDLPPGTLTQRTMIYAVRIHPEAPASTQGIFHNALADEAKEHADYQAAILLQGHHSWESRFHRINSKLPGGVLAQEVVAESWPNEGLVEACVDCVHSWRQSPGHWGAVRSRHPLFGYDIKRGRNGIWYATGIFGRH